MSQVMKESTKDHLFGLFKMLFSDCGIEVSDLTLDYFVDGIEASFNAVVSLHAHLMGS